MKFTKIFVSVLAAAGLLFLGASAANASSDDVRWLVISAESTEGPDWEVESDLCVQAIKEIGDQGYEYRDQTRIMDRITALQFSKRIRGGGGSNDIAMLYCYGFSNDIDLFDNGPSGPGGPF
jgi:hypothetical protein